MRVNHPAPQVISNHAATTDSPAPQLADAIVQALKAVLEDAFGQAAATHTATPTATREPPAGVGELPGPDEGQTPVGGSLRVGGGTIRTPGGYEITPRGGTNWEIRTPDGHRTQICGDPHVSVDDKHAFDFKRETSFLLPDGTRIECRTRDAGNGRTVSTGLTVMAGQDKVDVSGVDTEEPKIGTVQRLQPGELDKWATDEDGLAYDASSGHAAWDLVHSALGQATGGEVTGDQDNGNQLVTAAPVNGGVKIPGTQVNRGTDPGGFSALIQLLAEMEQLIAGLRAQQPRAITG